MSCASEAETANGLSTKTGLPRLATARIYDLRHTAITWLLENPTVSAQAVVEIAGWSSGAMIKKYSHQRSETRRAALDSLPNLPVAQTFRQQEVTARFIPIVGDGYKAPAMSPLPAWEPEQPQFTDTAEPDRDAILNALASTHGNRSEAAKLLGLRNDALFRRLVEYGIVKRRKRATAPAVSTTPPYEPPAFPRNEPTIYEKPATIFERGAMCGRFDSGKGGRNGN